MSIKAREALKKCMELGKTIDESLGNDESTVWNCRYERSSAYAIVEIAKEALSEPLKNCDIGTAEEQLKRHSKWCATSKDFSCAPTMCRKCFADWSQIPYEENVEV